MTRCFSLVSVSESKVLISYDVCVCAQWFLSLGKDAGLCIPNIYSHHI